MKKEILQLLELFYINNQHLIISIYLGGSIVCPFIKNSHDIDIIILSKLDISYDDWHSLQQSIIHLRSKCAEIDPTVALLLRHQESFIYWVTQKDDTKVPTKDRFYPVWIYLANYMQNLFGEDIISQFKDYIIWEDADNYLQSAKYLIETQIEPYLKANNKLLKKVYHILVGLYFIENKAYDLTEEQIQNINYLHDNPDSDISWQLYENIKKTLGD